MDLAAHHRSTVLSRRGSAVILAAMIAALMTMAMAASAQATPNVAKAWGFNSDGELGNGTETESSDVPVAVSKLSGVAAISGGSRHSLALLEDGTVMAWGANSTGQLGNGTETSSDVPVAVSGLGGVTAVVAANSGNHSLALLGNGTVVAWGQNIVGQLGNGTTKNSDVPLPVCTVKEVPCSPEHALKEVVAISAGQIHSLALLKNGTVMSWGGNFGGQLGNGTEGGESDVPVEVSGLGGVTAISAGGNHSLALLGDGTVVAWGANGDAQLGNGTTTSSDVPVAVKELSSVTAIAAGQSHSVALLKNGTVVAWGFNGTGELGDGTSTGPETCGELPPFGCSRKPVAVSGLSGVSAISGGGNHTLALGSGTVKAWGENSSGQLGDGTSKGPEPCGLASCSTTPVTVCAEGSEAPCPTGPFLGSVRGIAAGQNHSLAVVVAPPSGPLPELGRCVPASPAKTGAYKGPKCTLREPKGKGAYKWIPGAGTLNKFTSKWSLPVLETAHHFKISCGVGLNSGEYSGPKKVTMKIVLKGCENNARGLSCQTNPAKAGEIETTQELEGEIGFIKGGEKPVVGMDLKPKSPSKALFNYECANNPQVKTVTGVVEGSVIGRIRPVSQMLLESKLEYKVVGGNQSPVRFEGIEEDTLISQLVILTEHKENEPTVLATIGDIVNEERLEIKVR